MFQSTLFLLKTVLWELLQIVSDDANGDDWGQIARDTFDLGLRARKIFDNNIPEDQKVIVKMI
ncbi:MAG: hypothetical protein ACR2LN_02710 [Candidatus Levyibacteriota bacterium]